MAFLALQKTFFKRCCHNAKLQYLKEWHQKCSRDSKSCGSSNVDETENVNVFEDVSCFKKYVFNYAAERMVDSANIVSEVT